MPSAVAVAVTVRSVASTVRDTAPEPEPDTAPLKLTDPPPEALNVTDACPVHVIEFEALTRCGCGGAWVLVGVGVGVGVGVRVGEGDGVDVRVGEGDGLVVLVGVGVGVGVDVRLGVGVGCSRCSSSSR